MIAIINIDPDPRPTGLHLYRVQINNRCVTEFWHNREEGLAVCLRKAADAVEQSDKRVNAAIEFLLNYVEPEK